MPRRCVIHNCLTKGSIPNKSMYKFPKDEDLCKKWLEVIKNPKLNKLYEKEGVYPLNKRVFVCSDHFEDKWLRDTKEPSQGIFQGAIPSINLNLSMETLLTNLRKQEFYKESHSKKYTILHNTVEKKNSVVSYSFSTKVDDNTNDVESFSNCSQTSGINSSTRDSSLLSSLDEPLDTLSVKDENLLSLIKKKKMNEKIEVTTKKLVIRKNKLHGGDIRVKNVKVKNPNKKLVKKLKVRIKGTDQIMNIIVAAKNRNDNESKSNSSQQTIKIIVPKKNIENREGNNTIKVVIPNSIDGKEIQVDRSEISKIINLVSNSKTTIRKQINSRKCRAVSQNRKNSISEDSCYRRDERVNLKSKSKKDNMRNNEKFGNTPLKCSYKKTPESNKSVRDFIESYFGEITKCSCDFTPQENIISASQRIIDLRKKLNNAQKLLSKYKASNRKISTSIEELRKQIPEKPVKPIQRGQLIKCILPRNKVSEKYTRGKHRFTTTLKSFAVDLFYSSPLSYSILEKIYLLPSRKTLKRWLIHPQNDSTSISLESRIEEVNENPQNHTQIVQFENLQPMESNIHLLDGNYCAVIRQNDMIRHNQLQPLEITNIGVLEDTIEPLQENNYEMIFRNDLAEAIMNT